MGTGGVALVTLPLLWKRLGIAAKVVREAEAPRSRRAALWVRRDAILDVGRKQLTIISTLVCRVGERRSEVVKQRWGLCDWLTRSKEFSGSGTSAFREELELKHHDVRLLIPPPYELNVLPQVRRIDEFSF